MRTPPLLFLLGCCFAGGFRDCDELLSKDAIRRSLSLEKFSQADGGFLNSSDLPVDFRNLFYQGRALPPELPKFSREALKNGMVVEPGAFHLRAL